MPFYIKYVVAALAAAVSLGSAQTYSNCNPMKKTCPPDPGLKESEFISDFTKGDSAFKGWNTTSGKVSTSDHGAAFTIKKQGDAPTLESDFNFLFGVAEVKMKSAPGTGVVSSIVMESDDLDEVDWEALGGDKTQIQSNYFGKGNSSTYDRAKFHNVDAPQDKSHTYTVTWTPKSVEWAIDGKTVRTLTYQDAIGGVNFPQTPMRLRIGIWAGGDPSNNQGTIEWAGGQTDYSGTPYTMYVESVKVTNYNPASAYKWSDKSGSYESIKSDNSTKIDGTTTSSSKTTDDSSSTTSSSSPSSSSSGSSSGSGSNNKDSGSAAPTPSSFGNGAALALGGPFVGPCTLLGLIVGLFYV